MENHAAEDPELEKASSQASLMNAANVRSYKHMVG